MRLRTVFVAVLLVVFPLYAELGFPDEAPPSEKETPVGDDSLEEESSLGRGVVVLQVVGEGAAPSNMMNAAQARILAKRAALADAYRKMSERVVGVMVKGKDKVENMVVTESVVQTKVKAVVRNAKVVDTKCDYEVCQVTLELRLRRDSEN